PYSPRAGTPAARMPQVDRGVARERAARLRALGDRRFRAHCNARIGNVESVLVETGGMGRSEQYTPVSVRGGAPGQLLAVRITGTSAAGLVGEAVRTAA